MTTPTRVALVEDHAILAEALHASLEMKGFDAVNIQVTANGGGRRELLQSILRTEPRVVILDLDLGPAGDGAALIHPLTLAGHRVVVLTASQDQVRWGSCLARGALTVVPKSAPLQAIVDVIRRVDQGLPVIPRNEREKLVQLWQERHTDDDERRRSLARLTPREAHVLGELAHGKRVREVAEEAFVSEATVRTQVKSILAKLGVNSQLAAVAMARDLGWSPPHAGGHHPNGGGAAAHVIGGRIPEQRNHLR
jgi:two-component system, NarL family, nitrate/nitrite response regulator NarL